MLERIDKLNAPPIVGRWYLVRTVTYDRFGKGAISWPVLGPKHNDLEFFNFALQHYHVDARFLTNRHLWHMGESCWAIWGNAFSMPCHAIKMGRDIEIPLPRPVLQRMQCRRTGVEYPFAEREPIITINKHYLGKTAEMSKRGWICPHRKVALGNQPPDGAGIITCPLHGLRIDARSGKCVGPARATP